MGLGNGDLGAGRSEASKDIAESPAACRTPKRKVTETSRHRGIEELRTEGLDVAHCSLLIALSKKSSAF